MKKSRNKQVLLQKNFHDYLEEEQKFQQIQMKDFKYDTKKTPNYMRLNQQEHKNKTPQIQNPYECYVQNSNNVNFWADKPMAPKASFNFKPNEIKLNGLTFVHKDAVLGVKKKQQNRPRKPQMHVVCQHCSEAQTVPANSHAFICFSCQVTQQCNPTYGIFICGSCEKKVWYMYGQSSYIKCTKCGTINNVPLNYQGTRQIMRREKNTYEQKINQKDILVQQMQSFSQELTQYPLKQKYPEL